MNYERRAFKRYFTVPEEKQLLGHIAQFQDILARRDHAWMRFLRYTGIRIGTLAVLSVDDARQALSRQELRIGTHQAKGGHGYPVPLIKPARKALGDLVRIRREQGFPMIPEDALVLNRRGRPLAIRTYQARMRKWCRDAGVDVEATPHWWRHTLAKRLMKTSTAHDPRAIAQRVLGHSSIQSTSIYTQPDREDVEMALQEAS